MNDNKVLNREKFKIQKAIYDSRVNYALENAERDKKTIKVRKDLVSGLQKQIYFVAKENKIKNLSVFKKIAGEELVGEVAVLLASKSIENFVNLEAWLIWAGSKGGQSALDKLNIEVDGVFRLTNPLLKNFFSNHTNLLIKNIDDYSAQWIANQINEGKDLGLPPKEIAIRMSEKAPEISRVRADRIVNTELANALVTIELEAARRYGIEEKIWRTSIDETVCPICMPMEGRVVDIDDDFEAVTPKKTMDNESVFVQGPPAHVNCRCFIEEKIPENWEIPDKIWLGE